MFCHYCGRELEEGTVCICRSFEESVPEEGFVEFEPPVSQVEKKEPTAFRRFVSVLTHFLSQPISAIRQAGEFADKGVGILCCVLQALLISACFCAYLMTRVQVGYSLGFFEQAIPFAQYLAYSGSSIVVLFFQLAGTVLLADFFLIFLLFLLSGGVGVSKGLSKMIGGAGTALLASGFCGLIIIVAGIFLPDAVTGVCFAGIVLSVLALYEGVKGVSDVSKTRLLYLFPLAMLIWFWGVSWLISSVPVLSWILGLL